MGSPQTKRATASDVAKLAGVSQSTVSRVFYQRSGLGVRDKTQERVLEAAQKLGYVPNAIAKTMASGKSGIIGVVVPSNFNLFHYQALEVLTNSFKRHSLQTMIITSVPTDNINNLLTTLSQYQVDGIVITSAVLRSNAIGEWSRSGIPVILFNGELINDELCTVQSDHYGSGVIMADHLVDAGYTSFVYVSAEQSPHWNLVTRQQGFVDQLARRGYSECQIIPAAYSYESGLEAGRTILSLPKRPDAVFCSGDLNAYGVMDAIREFSDLRIGQDIAIAGYDAPLIDELKSYSMTAMQQNIHAMVEDTVDMMIKMIERPGLSAEHRKRPMNLVVRSSTNRNP